MKTVLAVIGHYLPGYRAGGPVRTLANLVAQLGDEFRFDVLTRDRDLNDVRPYEGIAHETWHAVGKARVRYLAKRECLLPSWHRILASSDYDLLYLNSFFDRLTIQTLVLRRLGLLPDRPIVLAPRGEFSPGALALKRWKKRAYLAAATVVGLHRDLTWQASSQLELEEIRLALTDSVGALDLHLAPDLPDPAVEAGARTPRRPKEPGRARIVFVSRISRKKNLDYALRLLTGLPGDVRFDIYGPAEDRGYWLDCQTIIRTLPANVVVAYHGPIPPERVRAVFATADLFLFPTRGENFGHVVLEALGAGCPVLISDRTPWRNLVAQQAGWDIPLEQPERFRSALADLVAMDDAHLLRWSEGARAYAAAFVNDPAVLEANRRLFRDLLGEQACA